ncbi:MAG: transposase [Candidatus Helarchaeota archaeon]
MKKQEKRIFKEIIEKAKVKKEFQKYYFPAFKVVPFFKALEQNEAKLDKWIHYLRETRGGIDGHYSEEFLVVALLFHMFFQISAKKVGKVIAASENPELAAAFKGLSTKIEISSTHFNRMKKLFAPHKQELGELILDLEQAYIAVQQAELPEYYRTIRMELGSELVPGAEKILEVVPWHTYFPESIFQWDEYYSPLILYKVFVWSRLKKLDGCIQIRDALHEEIDLMQGRYRKFGQNLGMIESIPGKSKLYQFFYQLQEDTVFQTIETHARLLIRRNTVEPLILTTDSSSCKGQENDPGFSEDVTPKSNRKKTHKIHAVCDGIGIPLLIHRTQGEMNDMKGFEFYQAELLRLKTIAEEEGRSVVGLALDAGYASQENLQWIHDKLQVMPIPWPRNPRGGEMEPLLHWLENLRKRFRRLKKLQRDTSPAALLTDIPYAKILEVIETICRKYVQSGSNYAKVVASFYLEIGIHEWFTIYRRRATIEGTFGILKSSYHLLRRTPSQSLPVTGKENISKHAALVVIAMQVNAFYRYLMLQKDTGILKPSLTFSLKELQLDL